MDPIGLCPFNEEIFVFFFHSKENYHKTHSFKRIEAMGSYSG
jgi:hypothetical protein